MWVNNDNGMYTTRSLKQLYQSWIISPYTVKAALHLASWTSLQVHAKEWLTLNLNPWLMKANTSSVSPTEASWWPFAGPLPPAATLTRHKCQREPSACPTANLSLQPSGHHPSPITRGGFVIQITSCFWAKVHVFEAWGQAWTKWKTGFLFDKSHYLAGIQNSSQTEKCITK